MSQPSDPLLLLPTNSNKLVIGPEMVSQLLPTCISLSVLECSNSLLSPGIFLNSIYLVWLYSQPLLKTPQCISDMNTLSFYGVLLFLCLVLPLDYKLSEAKEELALSPNTLHS